MSDPVAEIAPVLRKGPGGRAELAADLLPRLRARPGEWVRIRRYESRTGAWTSRRIFLDRELLPGCELRAQLLEGSETSFGRFRSGLYARYVGEHADRAPRNYRRDDQAQARRDRAAAATTSITTGTEHPS